MCRISKSWFHSDLKDGRTTPGTQGRGPNSQPGGPYHTQGPAVAAKPALVPTSAAQGAVPDLPRLTYSSASTRATTAPMISPSSQPSFSY